LRRVLSAVCAGVAVPLITEDTEISEDAEKVCRYLVPVTTLLRVLRALRDLGEIAFFELARTVAQDHWKTKQWSHTSSAACSGERAAF
jgi:hypothetical protein